MSDTWSPQQYERFKNERSQPFFDLMDLLDAGPKIETAIDLGCGTGELTKVLHERFQVSHTTGLDSSANMIAKAQGQKSNGLQFEIGEIEKFQSNPIYDLIFSNAALQWCGHHPQLFSNLKNALKPGGQLLVQMPMNFDYPTHTIADQIAAEEPFHSILQDPTGEAGRAVMKMEKYAELLYRLGFREQKVLMKVYTHILSDREQVIEWVKGTMLTSFEKRLSPEMFQKFLTTYRQELFKVLPDEKPFFYPFKRLLMWARV
jgi:trans-aconitate 2-methyltransferase